MRILILLGYYKSFLNKEFPDSGLATLVANDVAPFIKRQNSVPIQPFYYEWKNWNDNIAKGVIDIIMQI